MKITITIEDSKDGGGMEMEVQTDPPVTPGKLPPPSYAFIAAHRALAAIETFMRDNGGQDERRERQPAKPDNPTSETPKQT